MVMNRFLSLSMALLLSLFSAIAGAVTTIDVLVLYVPTVTNPEVRAASMEQYANTALANSQSELRFHVVKVLPFDIPNAKTDEVTLDALLNNAQVATLRSQWGADLVSYITPTGPYCGVAYLSPGSSSTGHLYAYAKTLGFSVVGHSCTSSFAHELGHNLSLGHSLKQHSPGSVYAWGRGYGVDNQFVTVMAYTSAFSASRVQYFSNPNINACRGFPCGIPRTRADGADGVGAMAVTGPQIAQWLAPSTPPATNSPPVAVADTVVSEAGQMWDIDVLRNDSDPDGDPLSIQSVGQPAHGSLTVDANIPVYVPAAGFIGEDGFDYVVSDVFGLTASAHARILVGLGLQYEYFEGVNWTQLPNFDALIPVATGLAENFDIGVARRADNFGIRFRGLLNVPAAGSYTFYLNSNDGAQLAIDGDLIVDNDGVHGATEVSGSRYLSAGMHDIEVRYFDATGAQMLNVSWRGPGIAKQLIPGSVLRQGFGTVAPPPNAAPVANSDSVFIDTPVTVDIDVLANDSDPEGAPLILTGVTQPAQGSAAIVAGKVRYTPNAGAEGSDLFAYTIDDSAGNTANGTVLVGIGQGLRYSYYETVSLSALPDFTTLTPVKQGSALDFSLSEARRTNDFAMRYTGSIVIPTSGAYVFYLGSDDGSELLIDGQPVVTNDGLHGYLELSATRTLSAGTHDIDLRYFQRGGGDRLVLQWRGPAFPKQAVTAQDLLQRASGTGVVVPPVNSAPIARDDTASVDQGGSVTIDVLANDSDPDGDALAITVSTSPAHGGASIVSGGIRYVPNAGFSGADGFDYTISDGHGHTASAHVSVTVNPVTPPGGPVDVVLQEGLNGYQGTADAWVSVFHQATNFGSATEIKDRDGWFNVLLRFPIFQSEGGPVPDGATIESATLSLYKKSSYDHVYSATRITQPWQENAVTWSERLPGQPWSQPGGDRAASSDGQGRVGFSAGWLNIDVTSGVRSMALGASNNGWLIDGISGNANIKRFHSRESVSTALRPKLSIRYSMNGGGGGIVNRAPVANDDHASTAQGQSLSIDVLANDSDPDGDPLSLVSVSQPAHGTASIVAGRVVYAPVAGFSGSDAFGYVVSDGQGHGVGAQVVVDVTAAPPSGTFDIVLQQGLDGYTGASDAWIDSFHQAINNGASAELKSRDDWYRLLLRFPIFQSEGGPVPDGATIQSATLSLYKYSLYAHTYQARRLLTPWDEASVSWSQRMQGVPWSQPGGDMTSVADGQGSIQRPAGWLDIDVTTGVQAIAAGQPNNGWMVLGTTSGGFDRIRRFHSRETGTVSLRPKLTIRYSTN